MIRLAVKRKAIEQIFGGFYYEDELVHLTSHTIEVDGVITWQEIYWDEVSEDDFRTSGVMKHHSYCDDEL